MPKFTVCLNGTDTNPYHKLGLIQNPFPQLSKHEWQAAEFQVAKLGGDPIPREDPEGYIRKTLAGFSDEFVDLLVRQYQAGMYVAFEVEFPD